MLKQIRLDKNLSQSQLAAISNVNLRMIQKYEQCDRDINKAELKTLLKLCNVLDCDLLDLLSDPVLKALVEKYEAQVRSENNG